MTGMKGVRWYTIVWLVLAGVGSWKTMLLSGNFLTQAPCICDNSVIVGKVCCGEGFPETKSDANSFPLLLANEHQHRQEFGWPAGKPADLRKVSWPPTDVGDVGIPGWMFFGNRGMGCGVLVRCFFPRC